MKRAIQTFGHALLSATVALLMVTTTAWSQRPSLTWLGTPWDENEPWDETWSVAYGVSADGRVVVGEAEKSLRSTHAFRWTVERGIEDLNITYAYLLTDGSELWAATAISPNGRYIVGYGYNARGRRGEEAFLLDTGVVTPLPAPGRARLVAYPLRD